MWSRKALEQPIGRDIICMLRKVVADVAGHIHHIPNISDSDHRYSSRDVSAHRQQMYRRQHETGNPLSDIAAVMAVENGLGQCGECAFATYHILKSKSMLPAGTVLQVFQANYHSGDGHAFVGVLFPNGKRVFCDPWNARYFQQHGGTLEQKSGVYSLTAMKRELGPVNEMEVMIRETYVLHDQVRSVDQTADEPEGFGHHSASTSWNPHFFSDEHHRPVAGLLAVEAQPLVALWDVRPSEGVIPAASVWAQPASAVAAEPSTEPMLGGPEDENIVIPQDSQPSGASPF